MAMYDRHGFGLFLVELKDGGTPIGMCGLLKRDVLPDVDVGYAFLPAFRGRGLAGESATAVLRYAREQLGIPRVVAIVSPGNHDSIRLLAKLGMAFERPVRLAPDDDDIDLFAPRPGGPVHPNAALLDSFYRAFQRRDHATMAACYAPDATFKRPCLLAGRGRGGQHVADALRTGDRPPHRIRRHRGGRRHGERARGRPGTPSAAPAVRSTTASAPPSPSRRQDRPARRPTSTCTGGRRRRSDSRACCSAGRRWCSVPSGGTPPPPSQRFMASH